MTVRIQDVARHAGVSSATVSRVLSDKPHVRNGVKKRVLASVETLGYQPNRVARSLRAQRSEVIGLIISDIQNSFFNTVVRAIEDVAHASGYAVFLCNSDEDPVKEKRYLDLLFAERVAGVILTPTSETQTDFANLTAAGIPVVAVDRRAGQDSIDTVLTNNKEVAKQLVASLIGRGHSRIAALLSDISITTGHRRLEGYRDAFRRAGLAPDNTLIRTGKPTESDGYRLTLELLEQQPSALFTGSKLLMMGALRAIYEQGIRVPEQLELASFDKLDWMPCTPPMVYGIQPVYELGATAAGLLFKRIDKPARATEQIVLPSAIYLGEPPASGGVL